MSETVNEVPRDVLKDAFAAVLQSRLSWPQAEGCASDLLGYLHRQGMVVFREYHPNEEPLDLAVAMHLGSHWCTTRTVRDVDGNLDGLLRWHDADQPCSTSEAQMRGATR